MSCEIRQRASITELSRVKRILFPDEQGEDEDDGWCDTDAWSWKADFEEPSTSSKVNDNWLQNCMISCTPHSEVMVIARQDRYVVLTSKWEKGDHEHEVQKYQLVYPTANSSFVGEEISTVLCLPITSHQKTSQGMPDWICVILGYKSGMVRMYTTDGNLLMTEAFHAEPVRQIKFHTSVKNPSQQELTVLYEKVFIVVEGMGLFNSLKAARNFLAKGRAMFNSNDLSADHPPLHYRKFSLQEQSKINTCCLLGTAAPSTFDHLVTASVVGGFHTRYNNAPPIATGILSIGSQPYCAWHFAVEGSAAPLLSDVAYALASRVTSKILSKTSGWLGWGGGGAAKPDVAPSRAKEKQMMEPATSIYPRYGLADALREAVSVAVSPNQRMAAVTDSLGRVVVIDLQRGIAVRMWKGYRDAQCGWVTAWESDQQTTLTPGANPRTVAFLVIYISKRGIIEVWTPQQGSRIAAFNCVKGARLLNLGTGLSVDKDIAQCCLFGPDGRIDEISVPFHCALKGDSSQRARDLHLLQKFRHEISNEISKNSFELLLEIRHASVVGQALDALLESELLLDGDALISCLDSLVSHYNQSKALDAESRLVLARCKLVSNLVRVFVFVQREQKEPPDYESTMEASSASMEDVINTLQLNRDEVTRILSETDEQTIQQKDASANLKLFAFLRAFELKITHCESETEEKIKLKSSLNDSDREKLGFWLWGSLFVRGTTVLEKFIVLLRDSRLTSEDLASLLIHFWLNHCSPSFSNILSFHAILKKISSLAAPDKLSGGDHPSPWWQRISDILSNNKKLKLACRTTLVCRSVIAKIEKEKTNQVRKSKMVEEDVEMDDSWSEWEDMSVDMVHWSGLTKQLEELSHLFELLHYVPVQLRQQRVHELEFRLDETFEQLEFTLASILRKGRGSVTELIARWIVQNLLEPSVLFSQPPLCSEDLSESPPNPSVECAAEADRLSIGSPEEVMIMKELFHNVARQLPHSTEHDVILVNTAVEYAALWMKNPKYIKLVDMSLDTVTAIRSNLLRHGNCRTLWSMIFAPIFHDLSVVMDKTGRLPKTFSGRKVNLPSPDFVEPFLRLTMKLLDTIVTAAMSCEVEPPPFLRYDDIWPTCEGATPMIEVALRQRLVNIDLVLLHHQLAQALHLIASLEIKGVHCLSLFDQRVGRFAFFKDLHSYPPLPPHEKDPIVGANQLQFLKQVITKAVDLMEQKGNAALDYVNQAIKLGYEWNVDVDELRIKYVELLYANGSDSLANEVLPSIGSGAKLAPVLLASTGRRLKSLLKPADISVLSPLTTAWLAGFAASEGLYDQVADSTLEQIVQLLVEALRRFPCDCSEQIIAGELHALLISKQNTAS